MSKTFASGLVIGKFYPLHKGHEFLIQSALARCHRVMIAMTARQTDIIPGPVRLSWLKELFPHADAVLLPPQTPYYPSDCQDAQTFYDLWRELIIGCWGSMPEALFTSEDYGDDCERFWGCRHVCIDKGRAAVPVSGTAIRNNPFKYWEYLSPVVRAFFVKSVCVYGPESCGKSTLCQRLAEHYQTLWQPEWARDYLGDRHCVYEDMEVIARNQFAERDAFKRKANKLLFVDTDTITTKVFSEQYYGKYPAELIDSLIERPDNRNDLYLLLTPEVPWVADTSRDLGTPELRTLMFERLKRELDARSLRYAIISGSDWESRFTQAVTAVDAMIASR